MKKAFVRITFLAFWLASMSCLEGCEEGGLLNLAQASATCATWSSNSFGGCRHEIYVENNCRNAVQFRITLSSGYFFDYYVNPSSWLSVPVSDCGIYRFNWL